MKTKRLLFVAISAIVLFACKKNSVDSNSSTMSNTDLQAQSDDQARVSTESDAAFDDVNTVMNDQASVTGSREVPAVRYGVTTSGGPDTLKKSPICDAIVTIDTTSDPRVLTIIYTGKGCGFNRKRTGTVAVSIPAGKRWRDAGTQVTVTFNLTITRVSDGKSIKLSGSHIYTDVTGGNIFALSTNNPGPIVHTVTSSNMAITFDNGAQRTWNVARSRSYSYSSGLVVALSGTHTDGSTTGISEWGTNRFGNSFTAAITQPLIVQQSCSWQLTSGQVMLDNAAGNTAITFGWMQQARQPVGPVLGGSCCVASSIPATRMSLIRLSLPTRSSGASKK